MSSDKHCSLIFLRRDAEAADGGEILLAMKKRGFGSDRWNGAGGKIEKGETIEQALVREAIEEINIVPRTWQKVAEHDFVMDADSTEPWHMYVHAFICTGWDGEPEESEEMAPQWFKVTDIPYDDMWQDDIYWLPVVLLGKKVRCVFTFDKAENMLSAELKPVSSFKK